MPKLVVLDRPQPAYARHILDVVAGRALLTTHADADGARVFAPNTLRVSSGASMNVRALLGVLRARLYAQRRIVVASCAAAFVAGIVQPTGFAAPLFLCSLLGIAMALAQSPGLHPYLDRCEQGAPLFGRELARAKALVPCVAAAFAALLFAGAQSLRDPAGVPLTIVVALAAVLAGTLTALSATIRHGASRALLRSDRCSRERHRLWARRRRAQRARRGWILRDRGVFCAASVW